MKILSIETSCDETAVSCVEAKGGLTEPHFAVLGNSLFSQIDMHKEFGGVVPNIAKREHEKNLPILLQKTLSEAGMDEEKPTIDVIAVTSGPGLEPALWVGITFALDLGKKWGVPVIPVNHMEGHITSVLLRKPDEFSVSNLQFSKKNTDTERAQKIQFPALALLVSGGHTELVKVEQWGQYTIIGQTRDDAVGEAFDKVARLLGLPYPGGPQISKIAEKARTEHIEKTCVLPRPMIHSHDYDFSFSGLKTAVLYYIRDHFGTTPLSETDKADIAREFEDAVVDVLLSKTTEALDDIGARTLIIAGGVIANKKLRETFEALEQTHTDLTVFTPTREHATDNALMIASAAYIELSLHPERLDAPQQNIIAQGNLKLGHGV